MFTPWGESQGEPKIIANGIISVSTPGHGGMRLSAERMKQLRSKFPDFNTFAGGEWFEEDEDWAVVCLAFPEFFTIEQIRGAVKTAHAGYRHYLERATAMHAPRLRGRWCCVSEWLVNHPGGRAIAERVNEFEEKHADDYERSGMGSTPAEFPRGIWWVTFRRLRDGASRQVYMTYPEKSIYTAAELDQLEYKRDGCTIA
jgi:hypothetical protein